MVEVVNVNDVLDGHVVLDLQCLDRVYLNGYVPKLQVGGQVIAFLTEHLGYPVASPALFKQIGDRFSNAVRSFACLPCCVSVRAVPSRTHSLKASHVPT